MEMYHIVSSCAVAKGAYAAGGSCGPSPSAEVALALAGDDTFASDDVFAVQAATQP